jgi:Zn finger protein HypA/HybF involved in hydrogenase expression
MSVAPLARTLDQELTALVRGVSLECLVCGEFVMHVRGAVVCPECRSLLCHSVLAAGTATDELEAILTEVDARAS